MKQRHHKLETASVEKLRQVAQSYDATVELDQVHDKLLHDVAEAKQKLNRLENTISFLTKYQRKGEVQRCCPLCTRTMNNAEVDTFKAAIQEKTDAAAIQQRIQKAREMKSQLEQFQTQVVQYLPDYKEWKRANDEIRVKTNYYDELMEQKKTCEIELKQAEAVVIRLRQRNVETREIVSTLHHLVIEKYELQREEAPLQDEEDRLALERIERFGRDTISLEIAETQVKEKDQSIQEKTRAGKLLQTQLNQIRDQENEYQSCLH